MSGVVAAAACVWLVWNGWAAHASVESRVLTEAQTLHAEMTAVWDYIDAVQDTINRNADGSYDFKGVYCAVAGRGIAKRFSKNADGYVIRYVRENPRIGTDAPDGFEQAAIEAFKAKGVTEYHRLDTYDGEPVFRYVSALTANENCLDCHGEPAGTFDKAGFLKEGMELGDLAGAVSIIIPIGSYEKEAVASMARSVLLLGAMAVAIVLVVRFALHRWVTDPLARANDYLRGESEAKSNFLTIMSHELRTPLSSIIAATDFWEKTTHGADASERHLVKEIKDNSKSLLDMVNNTIDVARLEAGRFETTVGEVDVGDVVNAALRSVDALARRQGIELRRDIDVDAPIVLCDAEALRKIVMNLLSNALKFTDRGGSVTVGAAYAGADGQLVLSVRDTGIGIAPDDFDAIFVRFRQGSATAAQGGAGSGLGLFLVKGLAEKLGGTVEVASTVGKGSVFTVRIPVRPVDAEDVEEGEDGNYRV